MFSTYLLSRPAQGKKAVVLHQGHLGWLPVVLEIAGDDLVHLASQGKPRISVGDDGWSRAADHNFIREEAAADRFLEADGAGQRVDGRGVGVAREVDAGQVQSQRMQHRFHGGPFLTLRTNLGRAQLLVDLLVGQIGAIEHGQHGLEAHMHEAGGFDTRKVHTAGLDPEGLLVGPGGSVALTQDDVVVRRVAQAAGHGDELL